MNIAQKNNDTEQLQIMKTLLKSVISCKNILLNKNIILILFRNYDVIKWLGMIQQVKYGWMEIWLIGKMQKFMLFLM